MIGIIIVVIAVVIVFFFISIYNNLVSLRMKVREGFSTIDVFLKKRYDLIPNLVETVKGYANHEKETLNQVIEARGKALSSSVDDKLKYEGELSNALSRLLMLSENYPDLKADTQFVNLQNQLQQIESEIEKSRRYYNGVVREFNTSIQKFPNCIVASMFKFKEEIFFELESINERENIKIEF
ncbi:LemA family protein [Romboutsia sp. CE17]|uniref:LemA family protein n=1 Tax=Romboutsia sp. CE17 TaxID=2724150 RepID=UPI001442DE48|nr:LemA family protein [Romboutsia sp. CE17]QJA08243.1 LemA family protein [Romboutsia sp. CE17]